MDILYEAASMWKSLTEYRYIFTYGYKKQLYTIHLTFSLEDFPHLAGFQYLKDLSLPRYNSGKIIGKILDHKITFPQVCKSSQYKKMVEPRLEALIHMKEIIENDFQLFSYMPQMYPFTTTIKADYLISSRLNKTSFVFMINTMSDNRKSDYLCCSAFVQGDRNYEANQRSRSLLKKERIHLPSSASTILFNKIRETS